MSNATKIEGTNTTNAIATGNIPVHMKVISWSYRRRGKVARVHNYITTCIRCFNKYLYCLDYFIIILIKLHKSIIQILNIIIIVVKLYLISYFYSSLCI
jgi:Pyruvate/2-oxoacid:ferredoxin oxidoreductase delta subunit